MEYAEGAGPDKRCYRANFGKINRVLPQFQPKWTVRTGIEELYEAYQANNLDIDELEGSRYLRIKHIRKLMDGDRIDDSMRWKSQGGDKPSCGTERTTNE